MILTQQQLKSLKERNILRQIEYLQEHLKTLVELHRLENKTYYSFPLIREVSEELLRAEKELVKNEIIKCI